MPKDNSFDTDERIAEEITSDQEEEIQITKTPEELLKEEIAKKDDEISLLKLTLANKLNEIEHNKLVCKRQSDFERIATMKDVCTKFSSILENFSRAISSCKDKIPDSVLSGLNMVLDRFVQVLIELGITEIQCIGAPFNPEFHEAIAHIKVDDVRENTVVEVYSKGYMWEGKVIKHAIVCVAN